MQNNQTSESARIGAGGQSSDLSTFYILCGGSRTSARKARTPAYGRKPSNALEARRKESVSTNGVRALIPNGQKWSKNSQKGFGSSKNAEVRQEASNALDRQVDRTRIRTRGSKLGTLSVKLPCCRREPWKMQTIREHLRASQHATETKRRSFQFDGNGLRGTPACGKKPSSALETRGQAKSEREIGRGGS